MKKPISAIIAMTMLASMLTSIPANAYSPNSGEDIYEPGTILTVGAKKPAQVKVKAAYTSGCKAVKISWNKVSNATGYRVYRFSGKKWVKVGNTSKTAYKITGLKAGTQYKFKVKAFRRTNNGTVWGKASKVKNVATKPSKPTITAASAAQDSIKLRWKEVRCDGYQIFQKIDGKYTKIATVKGSENVTYKVTGLESSTKYSFKVRAYKRDADKNIRFSSYSVKDKTTSSLYWSPIMKAWYNCMICEATDEQIAMVEHDLTQATIDACNGKTEFEFEIDGKTEKIYAKEAVNFIENKSLTFKNNNAHREYKVFCGWGNDCFYEKKLKEEGCTDPNYLPFKNEQERYDYVKEFIKTEHKMAEQVPYAIAKSWQYESDTIDGGDWEINWNTDKLSDEEWWIWFCDEAV